MPEARLELELSDREAAIVGELRLAGVRSDADLVRVALWRFGQHLEYAGLKISDFELLEDGRRRRST